MSDLDRLLKLERDIEEIRLSGHYKPMDYDRLEKSFLMWFKYYVTNDNQRPIKQLPTTCGEIRESYTESKSEKPSKAKERFNKCVFIKCKLAECFPEHKYIEKEDIFYCEKLNIGDVNWD